MVHSCEYRHSASGTDSLKHSILFVCLVFCFVVIIVVLVWFVVVVVADAHFSYYIETVYLA